ERLARIVEPGRMPVLGDELGDGDLALARAHLDRGDGRHGLGDRRPSTARRPSTVRRASTVQRASAARLPSAPRRPSAWRPAWMLGFGRSSLTAYDPIGTKSEARTQVFIQGESP